MNSKHSTTLFILALIVIVTILVFQLPYLEGSHAYQKGDYQATLTKLEGRSDKRSQQLYADAALQLAQIALEESNYKQAADYFALCEPNAHEQWSEAISMYIIDLAEKGQLDAAKEVFEGLEKEDLVIHHTDDIRITLAEQTIGAVSSVNNLEKWQEAKTFADDVVITEDNLRLQTFYNRYYFALGTHYLSEGNDRDSLNYFLKCTNSEFAETYVKVLQYFKNREYFEGIHLLENLNQQNLTYIYAYGKEEPFQCCWSGFEKIINNHLENLYFGWDKRLYAEKAAYYFASKQWMPQESTPALSDTEYPHKHVLLGSMSSVDFSPSQKLHIRVNQTLSELYKTCGTSPNGKILFLLQHKNSLYIPLRAMQKLPYEYFPENFSQVEYIILVNYDASEVGYYNDHLGLSNTLKYLRIPAYREDGSVEVIMMPSGKRLYSSGRIYGDNPPTKTQVKQSEKPKYISGGIPDLTENLIKALKSIEKQIAIQS